MYISDVFLLDRAEQFRRVGKEKIDQYTDCIIDLIKNSSKNNEGILEIGKMEIRFEFNISDKSANILTLWTTMPIVYNTEGGHES